MSGPTAALLNGGARLHLQHGPIDLIIGADAVHQTDRQLAFEAAHSRFDTILTELTSELELLREPVTKLSAIPEGRVARRMYEATHPHAEKTFVTPMAAVAGAVADEVLHAMTQAVPLLRAYVNNGGDIALHLTEEQQFTAGIADLSGKGISTLRVPAGTGIYGIATSGQGGRSLSFGIADSVTVLTATAAAADVAATLIANAVDLPNHPSIRHRPANDLRPDSDLRDRAVVVGVGSLTRDEVALALDRGLSVAFAMKAAGHIHGAHLSLRSQNRVAGRVPIQRQENQLEVAHG